MKFTANISRFEEDDLHWTSIIKIPNDIYQEMINIAPNKRLICTINDVFTFHCTMIPRKDYHFIMLGKDKIKKLQLDRNEDILVSLAPDTSEFGANMSEEFQEVLASDPEGKMFFDKLTLDRKQNIIYFNSKTKSSQLKIEKTIVFFWIISNTIKVILIQWYFSKIAKILDLKTNSKNVFYLLD